MSKSNKAARVTCRLHLTRAPADVWSFRHVIRVTSENDSVEIGMALGLRRTPQDSKADLGNSRDGMERAKWISFIAKTGRFNTTPVQSASVVTKQICWVCYPSELYCPNFTLNIKYKNVYVN